MNHHDGQTFSADRCMVCGYCNVLSVFWAKALGVFLALTLLTGCQSNSVYPVSDHYDGSRFFNRTTEPTMQSTWRIWWYFLSAPRQHTAPENPLPVQTLSWTKWHALPNNEVHVVRLGHSSLLLNLHGQQWLIDPVFSERASPVGFIGPKRFHALPIDPASLPEMDGVLISHDHYDHLDAYTIEQIHPKVKQFVTTLGVGSRLKDMGVPSHKITELDWQQSKQWAHVEITAEPAQHFSGRGLWDRNTTLWASWVIRSHTQQQERKLYYSADTGYFKEFLAIGQRHGPFDLAIIEAGAWDKMWAGIHMTPEEAVQAHRDIQGKVLMPVHNSSFELALHAWHEPLERITIAAQTQAIPLATPMFGEVYTIGTPPPSQAWWRALK
jgi:L-ascorbate metabolism protein UlaG (beta-lactamase superfamily)